MIALALSPRYAARTGRVGILIDSSPQLPAGFNPRDLAAAWASLTPDETAKALAWAKTYATPWGAAGMSAVPCSSLSPKLAIFCSLGDTVAQIVMQDADSPDRGPAFMQIEKAAKPFIPTQQIGDRFVDLTNWFVDVPQTGNALEPRDQVYVTRMYQATRDLIAAGWMLVAPQLGDANLSKEVAGRQTILTNTGKGKVFTADMGKGSGKGGNGGAQQDLSTAQKAEGYDNLKTVVQVAIVGGVVYYVWKNWKK